MFTPDRLFSFFYLSFSLILISACSTPPVKSPSPLTPLPFNDAISLLGESLIQDINADRGLVGRLQKTQIVIEPFIDAYSREEVETSQNISQLLQNRVQNYKNIQLHPLSQDLLKQSEYAIHGFIYLYKYPLGKTPDEKRYRVNAVARHIKTGRLVSSNDVWISEKKLNYARTSEYQDNPVYDINPQTHLEQEPLLELQEHKTAQQYHDELQVSALLNDAGKAYVGGNYTQALQNYQQAAGLPTGIRLRTFAGLYISHLRLGQEAKAAQAFSKLIQLSLQQSNTLSIKLLFQVNSVEFWGDAFLQKQYQLWLKTIAQYFQESQAYLRIIGHSSNTGSAEFNDALSLRRSKHIQHLLKNYYPGISQHSDTIGRGFHENIVGSGTDDEQDVLDRRVEFSVM